MLLSKSKKTKPKLSISNPLPRVPVRTWAGFLCSARTATIGLVKSPILPGGASRWIMRLRIPLSRFVGTINNFQRPLSSLCSRIAAGCFSTNGAGMVEFGGLLTQLEERRVGLLSNSGRRTPVTNQGNRYGGHSNNECRIHNPNVAHALISDVLHQVPASHQSSDRSNHPDGVARQIRPETLASKEVYGNARG